MTILIREMYSDECWERDVITECECRDFFKLKQEFKRLNKCHELELRGGPIVTQFNEYAMIVKKDLECLYDKIHEMQCDFFYNKDKESLCYLTCFMKLDISSIKMAENDGEDVRYDYGRALPYTYFDCLFSRVMYYPDTIVSQKIRNDLITLDKQLKSERSIKIIMILRRTMLCDDVVSLIFSYYLDVDSVGDSDDDSDDDSDNDYDNNFDNGYHYDFMR